MVADNKQLNSIAEKSPVIATDENQTSNDRSSSRNKKLLFIGAIIVLLLGAWAYFGLHMGEKVYAEVAGHKIYKDEIDSLTSKTKDVTDREAAAVLADKYLTEAMAKKAGISITDKDIEIEYGPQISKQKKSNPYSYQNLVNQLYFQKLRESNDGVYRGKLLVAHFSRYVAYQSALLSEKQAINPDIGNLAVIGADKKYAKDLITNLYNQIKSKKTTFSQAILIEREDPEVGDKAYPTLSQSGPFDTSQAIPRNSLIAAASIQKRVQGMKPGQLSQPFVVRVSNSDRTDSTAESYYLVVQMDSVSGKPSGLNFDQYVVKAKKDFGYKIYV